MRKVKISWPDKGLNWPMSGRCCLYQNCVGLCDCRSAGHVDIGPSVHAGIGRIVVGGWSGLSCTGFAPVPGGQEYNRTASWFTTGNE